jgi:hypothetical protein
MVYKLVNLIKKQLELELSAVFNGCLRQFTKFIGSATPLDYWSDSMNPIFASRSVSSGN